MKAKSTSCYHLKKQIEKDYDTAKPQQTSKNQFIPFHTERKLGKLIVNHSDTSHSLNVRRATDQELIQKINFKNFDQIYKTVMRYQNKRYSELTRKPQQRDLINKEWKLNNLSKLPQKKKASYSTSKLAPSLSKAKMPQQKFKYSKMDQYLFKKMSLVKQPRHNPQLYDMYSNYIEICQLNENIKRKELATQSKDKVIRV